MQDMNLLWASLSMYLRHGLSDKIAEKIVSVFGCIYIETKAKSDVA